MLWRDLRAWQIYGANTDVGKTIVSTILCKALTRRGPANGLLYLKPVSTGPDHEADDKHIRKHAPGIISKCINQYSQPVSPHLAVKLDFPDTDISFRAGKLNSHDWSLLSKVKRVLNNHQQKSGRYALLETAGGPLSPGPFGTLQADLYRPLRLPIVLVGDSKLGGIGGTISAFESLHMRGFDVQSVVMFNEDRYQNFSYLKEYLSEHEINAFALPSPPTRHSDADKDQANLSAYYESCAQSTEVNGMIDLLQQKHFSRVSKLTSMPSHAESIIWHPFRQYGLPQNVVAIDSAYEDHFEAYNQETDSSVEAAASESDQPSGLRPLKDSSSSQPLLTPLFDASASWWTQGFGHGNSNFALTAAHAAGRYGHVMFANAVHEPALDLSYNLLSTLKNPRLSRVFFTDNGSTGMEVAVKMALRASALRYGWTDTAEKPTEILGLKGSYHGDTIGVMNCSEPSPFNATVDWYQPWGHWFSPPEVKMVRGQWQIQLPSDMPRETGSVTLFNSLDAVFDFESRQDAAQYYTDFITRTLKHLTHRQGRRFGALILEPLIMGAGGMIFVDPLFQRTLINVVRSNPSLIAPEWQPSADETHKDDATSWSGLPVIADEVFTGLYRLGRSSSSSYLFSNATDSPEASKVDPLTLSPDISVHAKLLTAGLLPLALTTASSSIFEAFISDSKADALLHGHSYTAHAVGCAVANKALKEMQRLEPTSTASSGAASGQSYRTQNSPWDEFRTQWGSLKDQVTKTQHTSGMEASSTGPSAHHPFSLYSPSALTELSNHPRIESAWTIGTVLALTMKSAPSSLLTSPPQTGYTSSAAAPLQARLLTTLDKDGRGIHSRVLGDVIYFMTGLDTRVEEVKKLERGILQALDDLDE